MRPTIKRIKQPLVAQSEQGLTLLESLVAILVISLVAVSITPPIFLAVATRVQNRRAEQALQLAHGEIDKIRVLMDRGINADNQNQLPPLAEAQNVGNVPPPSSLHGALQSTNFNCSDYDNNPVQLDVTTALPVDVNGDCEEDFFVQTFRIGEQTTVSDIPVVFRMGVRVYSIAAEDNISGGDVNTQEASLQLTTGQGQQDEYPLAVMYTDLAQSDIEESRDIYEDFLND